MTNQFIKQQQELVREVNEDYKQMAGDVLMGGIPDVILDTLIQQTLTNTGEEIMGRLEDNYQVVLDDKGNETEVVTLDTIKQHIAKLTGVE